MATRRQVEAKLRALIKRLNEADGKVHADLTRALDGPRRVQIEVPDLGEYYWTDLVDGRMGTLRRGRTEPADVRLTASSEDVVALIEGTKSVFSSYLAGHIRVQASLSDLLALRKLT